MTDLPARLRAVELKWRGIADTIRRSILGREDLQSEQRVVLLEFDAARRTYIKCAADLDALLGALETEPQQRIIELAYQAARDQHHTTHGHREPFQACDQPDCRLFRNQSTNTPAGAVGRAAPPDGKPQSDEKRTDHAAARTLLRTWQAEDGWQPIETAPKSSHHILVWTPGNQCTSIVVWSTEKSRWEHAFTSSRELLDEPTHWQALPAPPVTERRAP